MNIFTTSRAAVIFVQGKGKCTTIIRDVLFACVHRVSMRVCVWVARVRTKCARRRSQTNERTLTQSHTTFICVCVYFYLIGCRPKQLLYSPSASGSLWIGLFINLIVLCASVCVCTTNGRTFVWVRETDSRKNQREGYEKCFTPYNGCHHHRHQPKPSSTRTKTTHHRALCHGSMLASPCPLAASTQPHRQLHSRRRRRRRSSLVLVWALLRIYFAAVQFLNWIFY